VNLVVCERCGVPSADVQNWRTRRFCTRCIDGYVEDDFAYEGLRREFDGYRKNSLFSYLRIVPTEGW
jgi:hypothetical protein